MKAFLITTIALAVIINVSAEANNSSEQGILVKNATPAVEWRVAQTKASEGDQLKDRMKDTDQLKDRMKDTGELKDRMK